MALNRLALRNFRIHNELELTFSEKNNFIVGGNGQGKTTILEAIYFLCTTKNFRSVSDAEVVQFGKDVFEADGRFDDATSRHIRLQYSQPEKKKTILLDEKPVARAADLIGQFPVVLLTPDDHLLTQGYSTDRRKFADSVISQASLGYLKTLLDYNKTLRQRAFLLNQIKERYQSTLLDELDAWDEKLAQGGIELIRYREAFVEEFTVFIRQAYKKILGDDEHPAVKYAKSFQPQKDDPVGSFIEKLKSVRSHEIRRTTNLAGPHKDEFVFTIAGKNLKKYGSQGQHKTFQVALRFAQFFYLKEKLNRSPIFLLDDVFGELDSNRALSISNYLNQVGQAFITLTDFSNYTFLRRENEDKIIKLSEGTVEYA